MFFMSFGGLWTAYGLLMTVGGIVFDDTSDIFAERITQQALIALNEANAAILVVDGKEGVTQLDSKSLCVIA
jgi:predicted GTPase